MGAERLKEHLHLRIEQADEKLLSVLAEERGEYLTLEASSKEAASW